MPGRQQRRHRALGTSFLVGPDQRVDQHHGEDDRRIAPVAHARGQRSRDKQDVNQRALELAQEHQVQRPLCSFWECVRAMLGNASCYLTVRQPASGIAVESRDGLAGVERVPRHGGGRGRIAHGRNRS